MSSLKALKVRIQSVKSIHRITQAMKLISTSHFHQICLKAKKAEQYIIGFWQLFLTVLNDQPRPVCEAINSIADLCPTYNGGVNGDSGDFAGNSRGNNTYTIGGQTTKRQHATLFLLIASDKGLCAQFNSSIAQLFHSNFMSHGGKKVILCIGKRGYIALKKFIPNIVNQKVTVLPQNITDNTSKDTKEYTTKVNTNVESSRNDVGEYNDEMFEVKLSAYYTSNIKQFNFKSLTTIVEEIEELQKTFYFSEGYMLYNSFITILKYENKIDKLWPIDLKAINMQDTIVDMAIERAVHKGGKKTTSNKEKEQTEKKPGDGDNVANIGQKNDMHMRNAEENPVETSSASQLETETGKTTHKIDEKAAVPPTAGLSTAVLSYEPNFDYAVSFIKTKYVPIKLYNAIFSSILCECSTRMVTMDSASRNAEKVINNLTRMYNKTRQANITSELVEIISGMNALESAGLE